MTSVKSVGLSRLGSTYGSRWREEEKDRLLHALEEARDTGLNVLEGPLGPSVTHAIREAAWRSLALRITSEVGVRVRDAEAVKKFKSDWFSRIRKKRWREEEKDLLLHALEEARDTGLNVLEGPLGPSVTHAIREAAWRSLALRITSEVGVRVRDAEAVKKFKSDWFSRIRKKFWLVPTEHINALDFGCRKAVTMLRRSPASITRGSRIVLSYLLKGRRAISTGLIPVSDEDRLAPLPYRKTFSSGLCVRIEKAKPGVIEKTVIPLIEEAKSQRLGFSVEDFSRVTLREFLFQPDVNVYALVDESNENVFGATANCPTGSSRSTCPILHGYWLVIHPDYRGRGYASFWVHISELIAADLGYMGLAVRMSLKSPLILYQWPHNHYVSATLHREMVDQGMGYVPNLLLYSQYTRKDYSGILDQMAKSRLSEKLPELRDTNPEELHDPINTKSETRTLNNGTIVKLKVPSPEAVLRVEELIRELASSGEYFGWDEFLDTGHYNRRLLSSTHMIVAETLAGEVTGAALFGGCRFARAKKPANARLYLFVSSAYRERGIASALFEKSMKVIKDLGYEGISSDLFSNCHVGAAMLRRRGFVSCGSLMNAACVKGMGFTDSMLFYSDISSEPIQ